MIRSTSKNLILRGNIIKNTLRERKFNREARKNYNDIPEVENERKKTPMTNATDQNRDDVLEFLEPKKSSEINSK